MRLGDIGNTYTIAQTFAFCAAIYAQSRGMIDIFSKQYVTDGFCVSNKDMSIYAQSHAMCFYGDTLGAILMYAVVKYSETYKYACKEALEPLKKNSFSIFAHGCAHLYIAFQAGGVNIVAEPGTQTAREMMLPAIGFFLFWVAFMLTFLKGQFYSFSNACILAVFWTAIQLNFVTSQFLFTYVNSVITLTAAFNGLARNDKDIYYDMNVLIVGIPVGIAAWTEAVTCEYFLINFGGHFVFDMTIVVGLFVYFAIIMAQGKGFNESKPDVIKNKVE